MKKLLFILLLISPFIGFSQYDSYIGKWIDSGEGFENSMILKKIEGKNNSYKFSFFGWRDSYDRYAKQVIKFSGEMLADHFVIETTDNKAYYTDDALVEDGELPLYREGEQRCKVYFTFNKGSITVQTKDCNLIYGGFGVAFDGTYKKN